MNLEHLEILKRGAETWNDWRRRNPAIQPDLSGADIRRGGHIRTTRYPYSRPGETASAFRPFRDFPLQGVDLSHANLTGTIFTEVIMASASLRQACLRNAIMRQVDLSSADLSAADLQGARLLISDLANARFHTAKLGHTLMGGSCLKACLGLTEVFHMAPSHIDAGTLALSGLLPAEFLREAGVSVELRRLAELVGASPSYLNCFISYTAADKNFATTLRDTLLARGVPVWFAPVDSRVESDPTKNVSDLDLQFHLKAFCRYLPVYAARAVPIGTTKPVGGGGNQMGECPSTQRLCNLVYSIN